MLIRPARPDLAAGPKKVLLIIILISCLLFIILLFEYFIIMCYVCVFIIHVCLLFRPARPDLAAGAAAPPRRRG